MSSNFPWAKKIFFTLLGFQIFELQCHCHVQRFSAGNGNDFEARLPIYYSTEIVAAQSFALNSGGSRIFQRGDPPDSGAPTYYFAKFLQKTA